MTDVRLENFLQQFEVGKDEDFTHTSKISPCRKYFIADHFLDDFWNIYCDVVDEALPVPGISGLGEKPKEVVPLFADIDFRYPKVNGVIPQYITPKIISEIVGIYQSIISEDFVGVTDKMKTCVVLTKKNPIEFDEQLGKDGFHIHFPYFATSASIQKEHIRIKVMERVHAQNIFKSIPTTEPLDKIFDRNIPTAVWLLYGSRKSPELEAYRATVCYDHELQKVPLKSVLPKPPSHPREWWLPKFLSVRSAVTAQELRPEIHIKKRMTKLSKIVPTKTEEDIYSELIIAGQLVNMLTNERADNYLAWMEVGWALFNIGQGHERALRIWIEFSKKSDKFEEGRCDKEWSKMDLRHMTIKTLMHMVKQDTPESFKTWNDARVNYTLQQGLSMSENDIAKLLYMIWGSEYVCADVEKNVWYEFKMHRWRRCPKGITLRRKISCELVNYYCRLTSDLNAQMMLAVSEEVKQQFNSKILQVSKLIASLKKTAFKNNIIKEAEEEFHDETFITKMDENPDLLVFENGVYDSKNKIFRPGCPDDYCTKSTGRSFVDYTSIDPEVIEVQEILRKILPDKAVLHWWMVTTSEIIRGGNRRKILSVWLGKEGNNGKSVLDSFIEKVFGDYCFIVPTTLLTEKQGRSSSASPELAGLKGARVTIASETGSSDLFEIGITKRITGNDPFYARGLFKDPVRIIPQFKVILHCNTPPGANSQDKAIFDRLKMVPFTSEFIKAEDFPGLSEEEQWKQRKFLMDMDLGEKIDRLIDAFMWLLRDYFERFSGQPLSVPSEMQKMMVAYRKSVDYYTQFLDEKVIKSSDGKITVNALFTTFKDWYKNAYPGRSFPTRPQFQEACSRRLGMYNDKYQWVGWRFFDPDMEVEGEKG